MQSEDNPIQDSIMNSNIMKNKIGIVMGVANDRSLAWGVTKALSDNGADIILTYQGEALKKRIVPLSEKANAKDIFECDVSDEQSIKNIFDEIYNKYGKIDFIVHAIAYSDKEELKGKYIETSRRNFLQTLDISTFSFTRIAKACLPIINPNGGSLLTLTYLGAKRTTPHYNVMGVAKAALETSVKYMSMDLGPKNIRVNAISAGPMKTLAGAAISGARHVFRFSEKVTPLKNNPDLEQVGNAALYLLSDLSSGVSGVIHNVDGGLHSSGVPAQKDIDF